MYTLVATTPNLHRGFVTINDAITMTDSENYGTFYSSRWRITPDDDAAQMLSLEKFHSAERWSLLALDAEGHVVLILPGCRVKGWVSAAAPSSGRFVFNLDTLTAVV